MPPRFDTVEQQRAYWRDKSKRQYANGGLQRERRKRGVPEDSLTYPPHRLPGVHDNHFRARRPTVFRPTCRKCGQRFEADRNFWLCASCAACRRCGQRVNRPRLYRGGAKYCSVACYNSVRHEQSLTHFRLRRASWAVWFLACDVCGELFTSRVPNRKRCSESCQRAHVNNTQRNKSREYQRRTRYTAIRYWAVDDSPAALDLAATYFELRQQLRAVRHKEPLHGNR